MLLFPRRALRTLPSHRHLSLPPTAPPTFAGAGVPSHLLGKLALLKRTSPSAGQAAALPVLLRGCAVDGSITPHSPPPHDVLVTAPTGTGKTLAYLLPLFARLDARTTSTWRTR